MALHTQEETNGGWNLTPSLETLEARSHRSYPALWKYKRSPHCQSGLPKHSMASHIMYVRGATHTHSKAQPIRSLLTWRGNQTLTHVQPRPSTCWAFSPPLLTTPQPLPPKSDAFYLTSLTDFHEQQANQMQDLASAYLPMRKDLTKPRGICINILQTESRLLLNVLQKGWGEGGGGCCQWNGELGHCTRQPFAHLCMTVHDTLTESTGRANKTNSHMGKVVVACVLVGCGEGVEEGLTMVQC